MEPCTYCGRPAWQATGGMGGGIMPDDETHCLQRLGRNCRIAHEGYEAGLRMEIFRRAREKGWTP